MSLGVVSDFPGESGSCRVSGSGEENSRVDSVTRFPLEPFHTRIVLSLDLMSI